MVTTTTTTTYRVRLHCQGTTTQQGHQCRRTVRSTAEYPYRRPGTMPGCGRAPCPVDYRNYHNTTATSRRPR